MKTFVKVIIGLVITLVTLTVVIPGIMLALVWKSSTPPEYDLGAESLAVTIEKQIYGKFDNLLAKKGQEDFEIVVTDEMINNELAQQLTKNNTPSDGYLIKEKNFGINGVWVETKDNQLIINGGFHAFFIGMTWKTKLQIEFDLVKTNDGISLSLKSIKLGSVGATWLYKHVLKALESNNIILAETIKNVLPYASLSENSMVISVKYADLIDLVIKDDNQVIKMRLIELTKTKEAIMPSIGSEGISLVVKTTLLNAVAVQPEIESVSDISVLQDRFQERTVMALMSSIGKPDSEMKLPIEYSLLNQLIKYEIGAEIIKDVMFGNKPYQVYIKSPYITGTKEYLIINMIFGIRLPDDHNSYFESSVAINSTIALSSDGNDIIIGFTDLILAEDIIFSKDEISELLSLLPTTENITSIGIVLPNFKTFLERDNLIVTNVLLNNQGIELVFSIKDTVMAKEVEKIKDLITNNQEIINKLVEYLPSSNDFISNPTEDGFEQLLVDYAQLPDNEKELLLNEISKLLEDNNVDLSGIIK